MGLVVLALCMPRPHHITTVMVAADACKEEQAEGEWGGGRKELGGGSGGDAGTAWREVILPDFWLGLVVRDSCVQHRPLSACLLPRPFLGLAALPLLFSCHCHVVRQVSLEVFCILASSFPLLSETLMAFFFSSWAILVAKFWFSFKFCGTGFFIDLFPLKLVCYSYYICHCCTQAVDC